MKSQKMYLFLVGICFGALWSAAPAAAVPISSDEILVNGVLTVIAENPEGSNFNTGLQFSPANAGFYIPLIEPIPSTPNNVILSDVIWFDSNGFVNFASDDENGNFPGVPPGSLRFRGEPIVETGDFQDIGVIFGMTPVAFQVKSDVAETPLPSTWTFMLLGFAVFGFVIHRRTKTETVAFAAA